MKVSTVLASFLSFLLLPFFVLAEESANIEPQSDIFYNGHNLTITSYVLPVGRCAVGVDILACGVAENTSLGSSTWMYLDYNMASLALRRKFEADKYLSGFQLTYFETLNKNRWYEEGSKGYQMRALWLQMVKTLNIEPHYTLHLNLHTNYYFDETLPFSLRRPSLETSPWQVNMSMLHQLHLRGDWYILGEMGLIDVLRDPIAIHGGASIGVIAKRFSVRFGFSVTGSQRALFDPERRDYQQLLRNSFVDYGDKESLDPQAIQEDYALHPEFSAFYIF